MAKKHKAQPIKNEEPAVSNSFLAQFGQSVAPIFSPVPYANAWAAAFFNPANALESESKKASIFGAFSNFMLAVLLGSIARAIFYLMRPSAFNASGSPLMAIPYTLAVLVPAAMLVSAAIFLLAKLLGGNGSHSRQTHGLSLTYGGYSLMSAPLVLLSAIPLIGFLFDLVVFALFLHGVYNAYLVVKNVHGVSRIRAAAAVLFPSVIFFVLVLAFAIWASTVIGTTGY